eukprot:scaffold135296_cov22-Prasinocladus_malaysianus.AAC.1
MQPGPHRDGWSNWLNSRRHRATGHYSDMPARQHIAHGHHIRTFKKQAGRGRVPLLSNLSILCYNNQ